MNRETSYFSRSVDVSNNRYETGAKLGYYGMSNPPDAASSILLEFHQKAFCRLDQMVCANENSHEHIAKGGVPTFIRVLERMHNHWYFRRIPMSAGAEHLDHHRYPGGGDCGIGADSTCLVVSFARKEAQAQLNI